MYLVYQWPLRNHIHHNIGIHTPLDLLEVVMDWEVPDPQARKMGRTQSLKNSIHTQLEGESL